MGAFGAAGGAQVSSPASPAEGRAVRAGPAAAVAVTGQPRPVWVPPLRLGVRREEARPWRGDAARAVDALCR